MPIFPDISYQGPFDPGYQTNELPKSCKAMKTTLQNKGFNVNRILTEEERVINDIKSLENTIFNLIDTFQFEQDEYAEKLERVFHMIQIWGGQMGKNIYVKNYFQNNKDKVLSSYALLVRSCLQLLGEPYDESRDFEKVITEVSDSLKDFCRNIDGMGIAFATKHTRFWLSRSLGRDNVLPIYDSLMAKGIMKRKNPSFGSLLGYWNAMKTKSNEERICLFDLERRLFRHFQTSRINQTELGQNPRISEDNGGSNHWSKNLSFKITKTQAYLDPSGLPNGITKLKFEFNNHIVESRRIKNFITRGTFPSKAYKILVDNGFATSEKHTANCQLNNGVLVINI